MRRINLRPTHLIDSTYAPICHLLSSTDIQTTANNILTIFESDNWSFQVIYRTAFDLRYFKFSVNYGWVETDLHSWVELRCRVEFGANGFVSTFQPPRAQPKPPPAALPYILVPPQSRTFYILQIQFYTAALISHFTDSIPANPCSRPRPPFQWKFQEIPGVGLNFRHFTFNYGHLKPKVCRESIWWSVVKLCFWIDTFLNPGAPEVCADIDAVLWTGIIWALIIWQICLPARSLGLTFFCLVQGWHPLLR